MFFSQYLLGTKNVHWRQKCRELNIHICTTTNIYVLPDYTTLINWCIIFVNKSWSKLTLIKQSIVEIEIKS